MPELSVDGVHIHYEEYGAGQPILLFNELAADLCGWEAQVRHFARSYRVGRARALIENVRLKDRHRATNQLHVRAKAGWRTEHYRPH